MSIDLWTDIFFIKLTIPYIIRRILAVASFNFKGENRMITMKRQFSPTFNI